MEIRLQPMSADKKIILNSFIMSGTKSADLKEWWQMTKPVREAKNVLCLDNDVAWMSDKQDTELITE